MIEIKAKKQNVCFISSSLQIPTEIVEKIKNNHDKVKTIEKELDVKLEVLCNEDGSFLKMSADVPETINTSDIKRFEESHQIVINNIAKLPSAQDAEDPTHRFQKEDEPIGEPIMAIMIPVIVLHEL